MMTVNSSFIRSMENHKYFINHLIEKEGEFFKKYDNTPLSGSMYKTFKDKSDNIQVELVGKYLNNEKNGKWIRRWNNGNIKSSGYYKGSLKDGLWEEYNQKGEKFYQLYYENGILIDLINLNREIDK